MNRSAIFLASTLFTTSAILLAAPPGKKLKHHLGLPADALAPPENSPAIVGSWHT